MIRSFSDPEAQKLHQSVPSKRYHAIERVARRKLVMLDAATDLRDLGQVPGNRLERLKGKRANEHSIRINDRYRICFKWREGDAFDVSIQDYH